MPLGTGDGETLGEAAGADSERTETTRPTMARAKMTRPAKTPRKKLRTPHDRMPGPPAKAPRDDEIRQRKAGIPVSACPITRVCISTVPS